MPTHSPCPVAIALGANLGHPSLTLARAVSRLEAEGVTEGRASDLFLTQPVGCLPGTPPFLNGVLVGRWQGSALALLQLCQCVETEFGRPRVHSQQEARALDLDLVLFGDEVLNHPQLVVPHPRLAERLFVLAPLAQLAPEWLVPGSGATVEQLLARELRQQGPAWGARFSGPPGGRD